MILTIALIVLNVVTSCLVIRLVSLLRRLKSGAEIQTMIEERLKIFERNDFAFYRDLCQERKEENDKELSVIHNRLKELGGQLWKRLNADGVR